MKGEAWAQEPGQSLTLRDDTGQLVIETVQPETLPRGARVEIVGRPIREEFGWTLQDPIFRRAEAGAFPSSRGLQRLRLTEQVTRLTPEEADRHQAVSLRGLITWFDERAPFFYLQDASGGVRVRAPPGWRREVGAGYLRGSIELSGVTLSGAHSTAEVELFELSNFMGSLGQPPARGITLEQALSGAEEFRRVEMRGYVRQVRTEGNWTRLELTAATGEFLRAAACANT